jgi:hypothetical protein
MMAGELQQPRPAALYQGIAARTLDLAWYMLAEAEIAAGCNQGIADNLYPRLTGGKILLMEIGLRTRRIQSAIEASDVERFARRR